MNRHLVAVEVGIECRTNEGMELNRFPFNKYRLKCLYTQAVQSRSSVQHHRVLTNHVFEDVPYDRAFVLNLPFGGLYSTRNTHYFKLIEDERLEQFQRHFLRQPALM